MYKIAVKIKEAKGAPCVIVGQDKLRTLEQLAEILQWAVKPILWLLSWLGLNIEELWGLNGKFGPGKATRENLV